MWLVLVVMTMIGTVVLVVMTMIRSVVVLVVARELMTVFFISHELLVQFLNSLVEPLLQFVFLLEVLFLFLLLALLVVVVVVVVGVKVRWVRRVLRILENLNFKIRLGWGWIGWGYVVVAVCRRAV